jgi:hypothetical protein
VTLFSNNPLTAPIPSAVAELGAAAYWVDQ